MARLYRNRRISMQLHSLRRAEDATDKTRDWVVGIGNSWTREIICADQCRDIHQDRIGGDGNRN